MTDLLNIALALLSIGLGAVGWLAPRYTMGVLDLATDRLDDGHVGNPRGLGRALRRPRARRARPRDAARLRDGRLRLGRRRRWAGSPRSSRTAPRAPRSASSRWRSRSPPPSSPSTSDAPRPGPRPLFLLLSASKYPGGVGREAPDGGRAPFLSRRPTARPLHRPPPRKTSIRNPYGTHTHSIRPQTADFPCINRHFRRKTHAPRPPCQPNVNLEPARHPPYM